WPVFLYAGYKHDVDLQDHWEGLFQSVLLFPIQAYKHIFTSPSSVEKEPKATIMTASIAYIVTQTHFALSLLAVFSCTNNMTDSEHFYNSVLDFLDHPEEKEQVNKLLIWWNWQIFPSYSSAQRPTTKTSILAKLIHQQELQRWEDSNLP
ncbi:hypothetical protein BDZ94DRAFT_1173208, partial [Collybia nuda]